MSAAVQYAEAEVIDRPPIAGAASHAPIAGRLAVARGVIEGKFLDLGMTLEKSVEVVGGLIGSLDQLTSLFNAEAVDTATEKLSEAAAALSGLAGSRTGHRERCHGLASTSRVLGVHIADMQQALRYLRVFAVNIKVTAGTVPGAYVEFEEFAQEIYSAISEGRVQLDEFGRDLNSLGTLIGTALNHETDLDDRCAQVLPAVPLQLAADADTLAQHHKRVAAVAAEVGAIARGLQGKVAMALCGLQIGDTARQRVEHVETSLEILARRRAVGEANAAADSLVLAMLAAQLDDTADSFDREVEKIAHSLAGVAGDAHKLLQLRDAARGSGGRGDKTGDLARLEVSLGEAMSLVQEMGAAEAAALEVGRTAETTAIGLAQRINSIRTIKASIHSMALNANLKCGRLGDAGRPLSVVAVELRQYADALGETAGQAEAILVELGGGFETDADAGGGSAAVGELLETAAAPIREAERKVGVELAEMAAQGDAVIQVLSQATSRLNFQAEVSGVLLAAADGLRPADPAAAEDLDDAAVVALTEVMAEIGKLYTMARERQIHAAYAPAAES
ncbi:MAG: methyl-accepting chemotaxis protein [Alphaproteobacteria bacterium]|nr:methyl-accepting chemotaxis protein [Alphaproteobacteria bacterium]MBU1517131.1 methyl-accepting chemotaxis protein [Alphaproteobacteria bacterium]MBU2364413.1 methyl-accepting chemotaxis protein [Alphaproteobacteria bacterium]